MSFTPQSWQLHGLSVEVAELYGKPHLNACYVGSSPKRYRMDEGARCAICRRPATNVHHVPPLSKGLFTLCGSDGGIWTLRPSLFALCGSGTTGCHNGFHGGARFKPVWVWKTDDDARAWWSGEILLLVPPHDPAIYEHGYWVVYDRKTGGKYRFFR